MSEKTLQQQIDELKAENARLAANQKSANKLGLTLTPKGCIGITGMRKFPVTLYREEWSKVIAMVPDIQAFIEKHKATLDAVALKPK